jgi:hypothetical protein
MGARRTGLVLGQGSRAIALVAAFAVVSLLAFAPVISAAPKKPHVPMPDLKITEFEVTGIGDHPNLVVSPNGTVPRIGLKVTTRNIGDKVAPTSRTVVLVDDGGDVSQVIAIPVRRLPPHSQHAQFVQVTGLKLRLGFTEFTAVANFNHTVKERDPHNDRRPGPKVPVEARQWTVNDWTSDVTNPFGSSKTESEGGFYLRFDRYDDAAEQFLYKPYGPIKNTQDESGTCNGAGSKTVTQTPWANSFLRIDANLEHYGAEVTSAQDAPKYPITFTCLGGLTSTQEAGFEDLVAFKGTRTFVPMSPDDTELSGTTTPEPDTFIGWRFSAVVPK